MHPTMKAHCLQGLGFGVRIFFWFKFFLGFSFCIFGLCFDGLVLLACRVWGLGFGFFFGLIFFRV